jgi:hypothetical protein
VLLEASPKPELAGRIVLSAAHLENVFVEEAVAFAVRFVRRRGKNGL